MSKLAKPGVEGSQAGQPIIREGMKVQALVIEFAPEFRDGIGPRGVGRHAQQHDGGANSALLVPPHEPLRSGSDVRFGLGNSLPLGILQRVGRMVSVPSAFVVGLQAPPHLAHASSLAKPACVGCPPTTRDSARVRTRRDRWMPSPTSAWAAAFDREAKSGLA